MNNKIPCVSIITPCYNGEKTIGRLIQSVIDQTYDNIEFIIINDGSIDSTAEIIEKYRKKIEDRGYEFYHIRQENKGLGGAINTGLKIFKGDFFCWPDADDYLESTSIEERVKFLIEHQEYGVVTSNAYIRKADDLTHFKLLINKLGENEKKENQFELLLKEKSIFCPGCHMVRTKFFLDVNPNRDIFPARRGQNWQILLPIYYKYKRYFLNKPLYNYIDYPNSMSKDKPIIESYLVRYEEHENIIKKTLEMIEKIQKVNLDKYYYFIADKYSKLKMKMAMKFKEEEIFNQEFLKKKQTIGLDIKDYLIYFKNKLKL